MQRDIDQRRQACSRERDATLRFGASVPAVGVIEHIRPGTGTDGRRIDQAPCRHETLAKPDRFVQVGRLGSSGARQLARAGNRGRRRSAGSRQIVPERVQFTAARTPAERYEIASLVTSGQFTREARYRM